MDQPQLEQLLASDRPGKRRFRIAPFHAKVVDQGDEQNASVYGRIAQKSEQLGIVKPISRG
jgi:hypothetical protein